MRWKVLAWSLVAAVLLPACAATLRDKPARKHVTLLFAADLHAQLQPHPELFWEGGEERVEEAGGFARLAAAVTEIKAERDGAVLVMDGGDTFQGSAEAALSQGEAILAPLDAVGFDLGVPGNWEVVFGPSIMRERAAQIGHPLVAANVRDARTGERLFAPWVIREVAGVKIGVVGFTDPDVPRRQPPAYSEGLVYEDDSVLPAAVEEVRRAGADVVVLLSHIGLPKAVELTDRLAGIDLHFSADTHERTYQPIDRGGVWVVEPGSFGSFLGRLDLWVEGDAIVDKRWELIELTASRFAEDPEVKAIVERSVASMRGDLDRVVGSTSVRLGRYAVVETNLDNLLSDALREATGTEIALSNGFRFGTPVLPGPIRERDLWDFYPISTPLMVGELSGAQIRAFWEQELENVFTPAYERRFGGWLPRPSGMTLRFEASAPRGQRVREIRVAGEFLEDDRFYTVTACMREGDAPDTLCRIPHARNPRVLDFDAHEAVRRYLAKHPEVEASFEGRAVGEDLPPMLRTQMIHGS